MIDFDDRNIVLTGFMGSGKSTVGRALAEILGFDWVDTDRLIESRHGPIPEIFERLGEAMFRSIERNIASEVATTHRQVISTGGRMLVDDANVVVFSSTGRIFTISVDEEILTRRLLASPTPRPLLQTPDPAGRIHDLLSERLPHYRRFAQIRSDTESATRTAEDLASIVRRPTAIPGGHSGMAVLPLADPGRPAVLVTDDPVGPIHLPGLGTLRVAATQPASADPDAPMILLGGRSITRAAAELVEAGRSVIVVPTTPNAMLERYPDARVVRDAATLQTLPAARLVRHGIQGPDDTVGITDFMERLPR